MQRLLIVFPSEVEANSLGAFPASVLHHGNQNPCFFHVEQHKAPYRVYSNSVCVPKFVLGALLVLSSPKSCRRVDRETVYDHLSRTLLSDDVSFARLHHGAALLRAQSRYF